MLSPVSEPPKGLLSLIDFSWVHTGLPAAIHAASISSGVFPLMQAA